MKWFRHYGRLNPKDAKAYYQRGLAYQKLGDIQQAITDLQKAADLFRQQKRNWDYQKVLDLIQRIEQIPELDIQEI